MLKNSVSAFFTFSGDPLGLYSMTVAVAVTGEVQALRTLLPSDSVGGSGPNPSRGRTWWGET